MEQGRQGYRPSGPSKNHDVFSLFSGFLFGICFPAALLH
jgi:hypothetical protein